LWPFCDLSVLTGPVNPFRMAAAFFLCFWLRWAYRNVIVIVLCPRSSCTSFRLAPLMIKWLAKVCLRSWNLKSLIPALLRTPFQPANASWIICENAFGGQSLFFLDFHKDLGEIIIDGDLPPGLNDRLPVRESFRERASEHLSMNQVTGQINKEY